ncbi:MAG: cyclase family protein [Phycisphaerales bacterium]
MLYDITPPVTPSLAVWPGDTPMSREVLLDMQKGDNITLSTLRATVHLGAHADAPSHYGKDGETIEQRTLGPYLGPAQIIGVDVPRGQRITPAHLPQKVNIREKRVLFKTGSFPDPNAFNTDFVALSPELIDMLAARGVVLIGIDTPSVDTFDSKDLPAHNALLRNNMAVLEGIDLSEVPFGRYELIALPLKLVGFDASPVRAVLRQI